MRRKIEFGVYQLDLETNELWKRGKRLSLPLKPAKVLVLLASSPGELVTRETLRDLLWGADTFVDFERGLNKAIAKQRGALNDNPEKPRFIETLPLRLDARRARLRSHREFAAVHAAVNRQRVVPRVARLGDCT